MMQWAEDDLDDGEFPDDVDDDNDNTSTRNCSECGTEIYEDIEQCPHCGTWLTASTSAWAGRQWWWLAISLCGVLALVWRLRGAADS